MTMMMIHDHDYDDDDDDECIFVSQCRVGGELGKANRLGFSHNPVLDDADADADADA